MNRRTFLTATPVAAAAMATANTALAAKPGKTKPSASPSAAVAMAPSLTDIKPEDPPDAHVVLTPFRLTGGGVGIAANPRSMKIDPEGGYLMFGEDGDWLTVRYPTPPLAMHNERLEVSVRGVVRSTMRVSVVAWKPDGPNKWKAVKQSVKTYRPSDNRFSFVVPTAMVDAGARLEIRITSIDDIWILHNCTIQRVKNPSSRPAARRQRGRVHRSR
ncbi:MAG: hypothetical protein AAF721_34980 [Myxococcota bacterium]